MTVSSLWKALDKAACGQFVGEHELANPDFVTKSSTTNTSITNDNNQANMNPRNMNCWNHDVRSSANNGDGRQQGSTRHRSRRPQTLAIDLSIWICESLTSSTMSENHCNPTLNLVFSRTIRLLTMGIKLIFVIEGKRRIRGELGEVDQFHKRHRGTRFWRACTHCRHVLELMGVPVVTAKSEGEALCALLCQRGIVDGVITNDSDCLVFGANVVYSKFSIENMENGRVKRYDLNDLRAMVDAEDDVDVTDDEVGSLKLSRQDLIAFALLTGSDLAGGGLSNIGHKKAIRFIRKCQMDNPLSTETAALDEMRAWAKAASADLNDTVGEGAADNDDDEDDAQEDDIEKDNDDALFLPKDKGAKNKRKKVKVKCCSQCCHPGSTRQHKKHGCEICGTSAGESCYPVTKEDRFRQSLRTKALALRNPKFEPTQVYDAYMRPNDNQIPIIFSGMKSCDIVTPTPRLSDLMQMNYIVRGTSLATSREYIRRAVTRLMSRAELLRQPSQNGTTIANGDGGPRISTSRERPIPQKILKSIIHHHVPSYKVTWIVRATLTDENGDGIDGFEYTTIEPVELIETRFPDLIKSYKEAEKERMKQNDDEKDRRRKFLEDVFFGGVGVGTKPREGNAQDVNVETGAVDAAGDDAMNPMRRPPLIERRVVNFKKRRRHYFQNITRYRFNNDNDHERRHNQQKQRRQGRRVRRKLTNGDANMDIHHDGDDANDQEEDDEDNLVGGAGDDVCHLIRFANVANKDDGKGRGQGHVDGGGPDLVIDDIVSVIEVNPRELLMSSFSPISNPSSSGGHDCGRGVSDGADEDGDDERSQGGDGGRRRRRLGDQERKLLGLPSIVVIEHKSSMSPATSPLASPSNPPNRCILTKSNKNNSSSSDSICDNMSKDDNDHFPKRLDHHANHHHHHSRCHQHRSRRCEAGDGDVGQNQLDKIPSSSPLRCSLPPPPAPLSPLSFGRDISCRMGAYNINLSPIAVSSSTTTINNNNNNNNTAATNQHNHHSESDVVAAVVSAYPPRYVYVSNIMV